MCVCRPYLYYIVESSFIVRESRSIRNKPQLINKLYQITSYQVHLIMRKGESNENNSSDCLWFHRQVTFQILYDHDHYSFLMLKLKSSQRNFYGRHHDLRCLVYHNGISVLQVTMDSSHNPVILTAFRTFHRIRLITRCLT